VADEPMDLVSVDLRRHDAIGDGQYRTLVRVTPATYGGTSGDDPSLPSSWSPGPDARRDDDSARHVTGREA